MSEVTIRLGEHELPVYPQRHAYLTHRFGKFLNGLMDSGEGLSGESIARFLGERAYEALAVLIPNLGNRIPEYEFVGYGSQAALEQARAREKALAERDEAEGKVLDRMAEGGEGGRPLSDDEVAALRAELVEPIEVPEDPYDEREDKSPSFPEIANAFEVAVVVNRFDALKILGKLVDPTMARRWVNLRLAEAIQSTPSLSSPSPSGALPSTSSGTTVPTSTGSGDGPGLGSTDSPMPTDDVALVS